MPRALAKVRSEELGFTACIEASRAALTAVPESLRGPISSGSGASHAKSRESVDGPLGGVDTDDFDDDVRLDVDAAVDIGVEEDVKGGDRGL